MEEVRKSNIKFLTQTIDEKNPETKINMKQIFQSLKTGKTLLEEIPAPNVSTGSVLWLKQIIL